MARLASTRRLPGFSFEVKAPPLAEVLPRMDVAIFVGFAASGPLEIPVAVESTAQFQAIFGVDAPLAWDAKRGTQLYSYLAPTVRAFFRNGGVRCWIVRVARHAIAAADVVNDLKHNCARTNYFPVPGLARAQFDDSGTFNGVAPAFARARAKGSWSDALRVSTALQVRPMQVSQVVRLEGPEPIVDFALASPDDLKVGDLFRFSFTQEGYLLFFGVKTIETVAESLPPAAAALRGRNVVRVTGTKRIWCRRFTLEEFALPDDRVSVSTYTAEPENLSSANLTAEEKQTPDFELRSDARIVRPALSSPLSTSATTSEIEQSLTLDLLDMKFAEAPQPGAVMRVEFPGQTVLLTVTDVSLQKDVEHAREVARISGQAVATLPQQPASLPLSKAKVDKLSFELWVRQGDEYAISLKDLAFESAHERSWSLLPGDEEIYAGSEPDDVPTWAKPGDLLPFPLAGSKPANEIFFPLAMPALPDRYLGPIKLPGTSLERDGLASFDANLFLDETLVDSGVESLLAQSEFVRYLSARPRPLHGIHAAIGQEEATIIAVPDALHRGWESIPQETAPPPQPSPSLLRPEWWHFLDCHSPPAIQPVPDPEWGNFLKCALRVLQRPTLNEPSEAVSQSGTYTISWVFEATTLGPTETVKFVLEEATSADFTPSVKIYEGPSLSFTIYGRRPADYYYRVRAIVGDNTSDWSDGKAVRVTILTRWRLLDETSYSPDTLFAVQRALLRMCAARGDLFALLSLPEHYREDQTLAHVATLKLTPERTPPTSGVAPLGYGEVAVFGYGAIYHPWLIGREEDQVDLSRRTPPCGAMSGILAQRANRRGAWIAPANETLQDVITLFPPILKQRRESLQRAQVNLIRQEPRGFLSLSADTLHDDEDFRPINVRRLLMLLRRMALRLGATYVFEPHSAIFRRLVERGFNAMLDQMFVRGAFAGRTPATSYQVVAGESLNTPQSIDQGRFIVELRVAPSLPMTFLTVRLVQTGDRSLVTEGRS
jgi:hypothetical protein